MILHSARVFHWLLSMGYCENLWRGFTKKITIYSNNPTQHQMSQSLTGVLEERHYWLIWATFDLEQEVWPVSHESYFNSAETRWSARFTPATFTWSNKFPCLYCDTLLAILCKIPNDFACFSSIANVLICDKNFLHARNTGWWEVDIHGCYSLMKIVFAPTCTCKNNRRIWRHNANTSRSRYIRDKLL